MEKEYDPGFLSVMAVSFLFSGGITSIHEPSKQDKLMIRAHIQIFDLLLLENTQMHLIFQSPLENTLYVTKLI